MTDELTESPLVDAHCHIDLFPTPDKIVAAIERRRVHTIAVTNAPFVFRHTQELAKRSRFVHSALGLHPELIASHGDQLEQLIALLGETSFIGEVGLDYVTNDRALRQRQMAVFSRILQECASRGRKIITVHSRRSARDVIAAIGPNFPGRVILHWFSGTIAEAKTAIANGLWFSVNIAMSQSANGIGILRELPSDRVLTETDGPFVKQSGEAQTPPDVAAVLPVLASTWNVSQVEARAIVAQNFQRLLQITERSE
jgi:TatD DNase family protein